MTFDLYKLALRLSGEPDYERFRDGTIYVVLNFVNGVMCDNTDLCLQLEKGFQKLAKDAPANVKFVRVDATSAMKERYGKSWLTM